MADTIDMQNGVDLSSIQKSDDFPENDDNIADTGDYHAPQPQEVEQEAPIEPLDPKQEEEMRDIIDYFFGLKCSKYNATYVVDLNFEGLKSLSYTEIKALERQVAKTI